MPGPQPQSVWLPLVILITLALGAVTAGAIARSPAFWIASGIVFVWSALPLTSFAARRLGVSSETRALLREMTHLLLRRSRDQ
ncbi:MAG TPA: hypothetical protein VM754_12500 [Actinomycetota bacterium]|nr:hypothetical protein [Actinomycetota bacterium]